MIGLFVKDCYLLVQRKQSLGIFLAVCLLMGFSTDGSFMVGYLSILSALLALSTISFDDADNGMAFLMTLPVNEKTYADSKYLLGAVFCGGAWVLAVVLLFAMNFLKGLPLNAVENLVSSLVFLPMSALALDLMIPLQLKFGAEKSRIVMIAVFGAFAAVGAVIGRSASGWFDPDALLAAMDRIPTAAYAVTIVALCTAATVISMAVSRRIMANKVL